MSLYISIANETFFCLLSVACNKERFINIHWVGYTIISLDMVHCPTLGDV